MRADLRRQALLVAVVALVAFFAGKFFAPQGPGVEEAVAVVSPPSANSHPARPSSPPGEELAPSPADSPPPEPGPSTLPPEVAARLTNGYYVLQFEIPRARVGLSNAVQGNLRRYQGIIEGEYEPLFSELGLDDEVRNKLGSHLRSIQHARVEAEQYLIQLDQAKEAFDKRAREMMSPDQYTAYREAEAARPAARELARMKEYLANGVGMFLSPEQEQAVSAALQQSKQTPELDGPYGLGVRAFATKEKVLAALFEDMDRLQTEQLVLLQNLPQSNDWAGLRSMLDQYYATQVQAKEKEIAFVSGPPMTPDELLRAAPPKEWIEVRDEP